MKVLIVHNRYQQAGGEDAVVAAEHRLLAQAGHDVRLAEIDNHAIANLGDKLRVFARAGFNPDAAGWLAGHLRGFPADIVHVHNFFPLLTPAIHVAAARTGAGVVQTLHNYRLFCAAGTFLRDGAVCELCSGGNGIWGVVHRCYRGSLPGSLAVTRMQRSARRVLIDGSDVDRIVALTPFARDKFAACGVPAATMVIKPNFVADPGPPDWDAPRGGALFVGRLSPEKGVETLVRGWHGVPDVPLTIIGDGPEMQRLRALAPANVHFAGAVPPDAVRRAMRAARVLMMPSIWYEGLPMTLVEAYAVGLPVIASRIGSLADLVVDGGTGRLFAPGSPESLADTVRDTFAAPALALAKGARDAYERLYSPEANLVQLEAIYDAAWIAAQARRSPTDIARRA